MRTVFTAAVSAAALLSPHASAAETVQFTCTGVYASYGTGPTTGSASCTVRGSVSGTATLSFTSTMPASTCPVTETGTGVLSGPGTRRANVHWQRVGEAGPITATGDYAGTGTIEIVTGLVNPCGGSNVTATFVITFPLS